MWVFTSFQSHSTHFHLFLTSNWRYARGVGANSPKSYLCQVRGIKISSQQLHTFLRNNRPPVRKTQNIQADPDSQASSLLPIRKEHWGQIPAAHSTVHKATIPEPSRPEQDMHHSGMALYTPTHKRWSRMHIFLGSKGVQRKISGLYIHDNTPTILARKERQCRKNQASTGLGPQLRKKRLGTGGTKLFLQRKTE